MTLYLMRAQPQPKTWRFFASSRLRGKACPQSTTKTRRREESRTAFRQSKNPFQLAKDFRLSSTVAYPLLVKTGICPDVPAESPAGTENAYRVFQMGSIEFPRGRRQGNNMDGQGTYFHDFCGKSRFGVVFELRTSVCACRAGTRKHGPNRQTRRGADR